MRKSVEWARQILQLLLSELHILCTSIINFNIDWRIILNIDQNYGIRGVFNNKFKTISFW